MADRVRVPDRLRSPDEFTTDQLAPLGRVLGKARERPAAGWRRWEFRREWFHQLSPADLARSTTAGRAPTSVLTSSAGRGRPGEERSEPRARSRPPPPPRPTRP